MTHSTWNVCGNISTGVTDFTSYLSLKNLTSRANVAGSHETYTTFFGNNFFTDVKNLSSDPFRGGSIKITSYCFLLFASLTIKSDASPTKKFTLVMFALSTAYSYAYGVWKYL